MTDSDPPHPGTGSSRQLHPVTPEQLSQIRSLIDLVQSEIPAEYRDEIFRQLLPRAIGEPPQAHRPPPSTAMAMDQTHVEVAAGPIDSSRLTLARYASILAAPGRTLLKALAALDAGDTQLGIDWMTPAEIERFLVERARVRSVYRTNISNALRGARPLADRRRHGRGYEYRITMPGRDALERELAILGSG